MGVWGHGCAAGASMEPLPLGVLEPKHMGAGPYSNRGAAHVHVRCMSSNSDIQRVAFTKCNPVLAGCGKHHVLEAVGPGSQSPVAA